MPSGVPPMPSSRSTPVPSRTAMIEPATSPSEMNLIRAPVSRISLTMPSWRGRSRMTTVTSSGVDALGLGDPADVHRDGGVDVDEVGGLGAGDQLVHVEDRGRVEHGAAVGGGQDGDGVRHALGGQRGAVDRVHGDVDLGAGAVADPLAVEEHRGFVLLALADDDDAVHRDGGDEGPHGPDGGAVRAVLVAAADPAAGGHGGGLGDPDELQGEVAVGGLGRDLELGRQIDARSSERTFLYGDGRK